MWLSIWDRCHQIDLISRKSRKSSTTHFSRHIFSCQITQQALPLYQLMTHNISPWADMNFLNSINSMPLFMLKIPLDSLFNYGLHHICYIFYIFYSVHWLTFLHFYRWITDSIDQVPDLNFIDTNVIDRILDKLYLILLFCCYISLISYPHIPYILDVINCNFIFPPHIHHTYHHFPVLYLCTPYNTLCT